MNSKILFCFSHLIYFRSKIPTLCVINTQKNGKYSFNFQSECKLGLLFCSTKTGMYHRDLGANITKGDSGKNNFVI